jgi:aspartate carbamoyltransferase catalytic subunit
MNIETVFYNRTPSNTSNSESQTYLLKRILDIKQNKRKKNLISCDDIVIDDINYIFGLIKNIQTNINKNIYDYDKKILTNIFFDSSTRTSISFEAAINKLGGKCINFNKENSSMNKGENIQDTIKTLSLYSDIIVIRHPDKTVIEEAINVSNIPIINAGNAYDEHPTQALIDLYTIYNKFGEDFKNKSILFTGDIKNSRTIKSLVKLLNLYPNIKINFLPFKLSHPDNNYIENICNIHNINKKDIIIEHINDIQYNKYDIIYCTRYQDTQVQELDNDSPFFTIDKIFVNQLNEDSIVMHPFPRNKELHTDVDDNHRNYYFKQMENGVIVRMAIIEFLINEGKGYL